MSNYKFIGNGIRESNDLSSFGVMYYNERVKKSPFRLKELHDLGNKYQEKFDNFLNEMRNEVDNELAKMGYENTMGVLRAIEDEDESYYYIFSLNEHDEDDINEFSDDDKLQYCLYCCRNEDELSFLIEYIKCTESSGDYYFTK